MTMLSYAFKVKAARVRACDPTGVQSATDLLGQPIAVVFCHRVHMCVCVQTERYSSPRLAKFFFFLFTLFQLLFTYNLFCFSHSSLLRFGIRKKKFLPILSFFWRASCPLVTHMQMSRVKESRSKQRNLLLYASKNFFFLKK